jgi:hypothetical protein
MRRLALALLTTTLCAAPAHADQAPALCKALRGLAEEARRTGQPQRRDPVVLRRSYGGERPSLAGL